MKIVSPKVLAVLIAFYLLACNHYVNNEDSESNDNVAVFKSNNPELTKVKTPEFIPESNFSDWKSIMDDDREL